MSRPLRFLTHPRKDNEWPVSLPCRTTAYWSTLQRQLYSVQAQINVLWVVYNAYSIVANYVESRCQGLYGSPLLVAEKYSLVRVMIDYGHATEKLNKMRRGPLTQTPKRSQEAMPR